VERFAALLDGLVYTPQRNAKLRLIERWLATPGYRAELERREGPHDEAAIRAHTREHIAAMQAQADGVFNNFLDLVGRPQRRVVLPSREFG